MRARKRWFIAVPLAILVLYFAFSPIVLAQFLLFRPSHGAGTFPTPVFGAPVQSVVFRSPTGRKLQGLFARRASDKFVVLLHTGQTGDLYAHFGLLKTMLMAGCSVFMYDYEGYGDSEGTPSTAALVADADAAFRYLVNAPDIGAREFVTNNSTVPVLMIHGANDKVISVHHLAELRKLSTAPTVALVDGSVNHCNFSTLVLAEHIRKFARGL